MFLSLDLFSSVLFGLHFCCLYLSSKFLEITNQGVLLADIDRFDTLE